MGNLVVFLAELLIVREDPLGFMVLAGEHRNVGLEGVAFGQELLIFPPQ